MRVNKCDSIQVKRKSELNFYCVSHEQSVFLVIVFVCKSKAMNSLANYIAMGVCFVYRLLEGEDSLSLKI